MRPLPNGRLGLLPLLSLLAILSWGSPAGAHAAPHSLVLLDVRAHDVGAELRLPVSELETAWHRPLLAEGSAIREQEASALGAYVLLYLHAESPAGSPTFASAAPWTVSVGALDYRVDDEVPYVVVHVRLAPAEGRSPQVFVLDYDVISHEVTNHTAWVAVRSDFANGLFPASSATSGGSPATSGTLVGVIRYLRKSLLVDRSGGGSWRGFRGVVQLGMQHISEGTDHLLFLLALLLPAPLLVATGTRRGRWPSWGAYGGTRRSLLGLLRVVSAFTIGHSITLLAAATGWLRVPSPPVEVLIALSILVSAVHAMRPLFPGRETWVAAGFGLVHGMAFAGALTDLHLEPTRLALAVFGFNLGIEVMQLAVVAVTFPWLMLLARSSTYRVVRPAGALFAAAASLGWIAERTVHVRNPVEPVVAALAAHPRSIVAAMAIAALLTTLASRTGTQAALEHRQNKRA